MKISSFFKNSKPGSRLLGLFFLFLASSLIATPLSLLAEALEPDGVEAATRFSLVANGLTQLVAFLLPACLFALLFSPQPRQLLGLRLQRHHWFLGLVAMATTILLVPLTDALSAWNEAWNLGLLEDSMRKLSLALELKTQWMLSSTTPGDLLLQILVMALLPAICEELFFRAALQSTLQSLVRNSHIGILLTAVLFSLLHGDIYGFIPRLLLGILLGYLFWSTGSILVSACAHFINNLAIILLAHFYTTGRLAVDPFSPIGLPWLLTLGCTLGAILLLYIYFFKNTKITPANPDSTPRKTEC